MRFWMWPGSGLPCSMWQFDLRICFSFNSICVFPLISNKELLLSTISGVRNRITGATHKIIKQLLELGLVLSGQCQSWMPFFFFFFSFFLFVVNFVIHWNEKALGSHVNPELDAWGHIISMGTAQSELMIDYLQPLEVRLPFCAYSKVELC